MMFRVLRDSLGVVYVGDTIGIEDDGTNRTSVKQM